VNLMIWAVEHPRWCLPQYCTATDSQLPLDGGEHQSEPIGLDLRRVMTNRGGLSAAGVGSAYLTQAACPWPTETYLHLEADGEDMTIPLSQAAGVLAQLTDLLYEGTK
jgi:hypothetical protein